MLVKAQELSARPDHPALGISIKTMPMADYPNVY